MKKFKKILAMILAAVLLVVGSVAATVAYLTLTDVDPKLNVFSVGDISISVNEKVDTEGVAQVQQTVDNEGKVSGASYTDIMPGDKLIKEITVTNDGERPAYVALTVTVNHADIINEAIDEVYENDPYNYTAEQVQAVYDKVFDGWDLRYDHENRALGMRLTSQKATDDILLHVDSTKTTADYFFYAKDNWFQTAAEKNNTGYGLYPQEDGYYAADMAANEWNYTYYLHLDPGESFTPFEGLNVPVEFNREQLAMFEGLQIKASASAIQSENTVNAKNAFAILAGDVSAIPTTVSDAAGLQAALNNAQPGEVIVMEEADYGTMEITADLDSVTIDASAAAETAKFRFASGAKAEDVTITGLNLDYSDASSAYVEGGRVVVAAGAEVKNLTIADSIFKGTGGRSAAVSVSEPTAEINIVNCVIDGPKYLVYGSAPIAKLTIQDCTVKNLSSWAVMLNAGDAVGAQLIIDNCTFENCNGGIAKYLGSTQPEGAFTVFTGNTLTNCVGHDGSDAKWFTIPGAASTITVSGNTLDGAAWTPGSAQGLGK